MVKSLFGILREGGTRKKRGEKKPLFCMSRSKSKFFFPDSDSDEDDANLKPKPPPGPPPHYLFKPPPAVVENKEEIEGKETTMFDNSMEPVDESTNILYTIGQNEISEPNDVDYPSIPHQDAVVENDKSLNEMNLNENPTFEGVNDTETLYSYVYYQSIPYILGYYDPESQLVTIYEQTTMEEYQVPQGDLIYPDETNLTEATLNNNETLPISTDDYSLNQETITPRNHENITDYLNPEIFYSPKVEAFHINLNEENVNEVNMNALISHEGFIPDENNFDIPSNNPLLTKYEEEEDHQEVYESNPIVDEVMNNGYDASIINFDTLNELEMVNVNEAREIEERKEKATIKIQASWRGHQAREKLLEIEVASKLIV